MGRRALLFLLLAGCGTGPAPRSDAGPVDAGPTDAGPPVFIALDEDFAPYRDWASFLLADGGADGGPYKRVYLNRLPPHGSAAFPLGTLIVKEGATLDDGGLEYDGMAKRGGGYNAAGAPGWEFFSLLPDGQGGLFIHWRGTGNWLTGGGYQSSGVSCAACHGAATGNDSVQSAPLQLGRF